MTEIMVPLVVNTPYTNKCETCQGVHYIYSFQAKEGPFDTPSKRGDKWLDLDGKEGWYHGTLMEMPCPDCRPGAQVERLIQNTGLSPADQSIRLSEFKTTGSFADKTDAKHVIARLAGMGKQAEGFVTIWGNYGVGKSFLAKALVNELAHNGAQARYVLGSDLIADIRSKFDEDAHRIIAVENAIYTWQMYFTLVIDEFDKIHTTDWVKESVHRLLNARYERRKQSLTVLISNTDPKKLPPELGYLQSRMYAGAIVLVPGIDARPGQGELEKKRLMK